jgi:hypothetical protein
MPGIVTTARPGNTAKAKIHVSFVMDIEQFPLLKALETKRNGLAKLLAILNPALEAGTIPNPVYQDAKYELAQIVDAFENKISTDHIQAGKWEAMPRELRALELTTIGSPLHVPGKVKKHAKLKFEHPVKTAFLAYSKEIVVLLDAMASLAVVKRQVKPIDGLHS